MPQINICNKITCNSPQLHYTALVTICKFFPLYHFNKNRAYFPKNLDINQISCYNEFMQNLQTALLCEKSGRERLRSRFISTTKSRAFQARLFQRFCRFRTSTKTEKAAGGSPILRGAVFPKSILSRHHTKSRAFQARLFQRFCRFCTSTKTTKAAGCA